MDLNSDNSRELICPDSGALKPYRLREIVKIEGDGHES